MITKVKLSSHLRCNIEINRWATAMDELSTNYFFDRMTQEVKVKKAIAVVLRHLMRMSLKRA
jgi:hypothetical protein